MRVKFIPRIPLVSLSLSSPGPVSFPHEPRPRSR